jgi:hypothetical protein
LFANRRGHVGQRVVLPEVHVADEPESLQSVYVLFRVDWILRSAVSLVRTKVPHRVPSSTRLRTAEAAD